MDRQQLLNQIVESAQKDLEKMAQQQPADEYGTPKGSEEGVKAEEKPVTISKIVKKIKTDTQDGDVTVNEEKVNTSTSYKKLPDPSDEKFFEKIASENDLVGLLKEASSYVAQQDDIEAALYKLASEMALENTDLVKMAEEFGEIAASSFLESLEAKK